MQLRMIVFFNLLNKAKKILIGALILLINIVLMGYQMIRQIVLPGRNRKGNVLSSLFLFFVDLAEKVFAFEQNILHSSWLLKNRFAKQALIIATGFLFLVSSVEWTVNTYPNPNPGRTDTVKIASTIAVVAGSHPEKQVEKLITVTKKTGRLFCVGKVFYENTGTPISSKRFLLFRVFRI